MSATALSKDTQCRSLGYVDWPPRGYFRTMKTCYNAKGAPPPAEPCVSGCLSDQTYPNAQASIEAPVRSPPVTLTLQNALYDSCKDTASVAFAVTVDNVFLGEGFNVRLSLPIPFAIQNPFDIVGECTFDLLPAGQDIFPGMLPVVGDVVTNEALIVVPGQLDSPNDEALVTVQLTGQFKYCAKALPALTSP